MKQSIMTALRDLVDLVPPEIQKVPLSGWTESVLRYFYCRCLAQSSPDIKQFVECDKIDLVLRHGTATAFIEFKFYQHSIRYDPYDGRKLGYKGGPGARNLSEFRCCVDKLHARRAVPELSKYIVLFYVDPPRGSERPRRFSAQYDQYSHPTPRVPLLKVGVTLPIKIPNESGWAQLYELSAANANWPTSVDGETPHVTHC